MAATTYRTKGDVDRDDNGINASGRGLGLMPWESVAAEFSRRHPEERINRSRAEQIGVEALAKIRRAFRRTGYQASDV